MQPWCFCVCHKAKSPIYRLCEHCNPKRCMKGETFWGDGYRCVKEKGHTGEHDYAIELSDLKKLAIYREWIAEETTDD